MKSVINTQILFCNNVKETFDSKLCNMPFYASVKAQGLGSEEEEEVSLRIEKVFKKKSVSIANPTPILPALYS